MWQKGTWPALQAICITVAGRECVVPEINRNKNIGQKGVNMQTSVFKRYLAQMSWSTEPIHDWGDLSYLLLHNYTAHLQDLLSAARLWDQPLTARAITQGERGQVTISPS